MRQSISVFFILILNYSLGQSSLRSSKSSTYYQDYYSKHIDKAIPFDSITYDDECRYNWKDSLFTGYLVRVFKDQSQSLIIITNGLQTGRINRDTLGKVTTISFDSTNILEIEIDFYENEKVYSFIVYKKSDYNSNWCNRQWIQDIFGPGPTNAEVKMYYENGKLLSQQFYGSKGMDSTWTYYHPNGKLYKLISFENGRGVGTWKQYNTNRIRIGKIKFKDYNFKMARWYEYDSSSKCYKKLKIRFGKRTTSSKCFKYNFDEKLWDSF